MLRIESQNRGMLGHGIIEEDDVDVVMMVGGRHVARSGFEIGAHLALSSIQMRLAPLVLLCCAMASTGHARLGDTLDQAEARYGLEKPEKYAALRGKLLEGAREVTFEYEGWRIRCALLRATDGQHYIVREEYSKIWNSEVMKGGGVIQIRDFERDAVLQAEGGSWSYKVLGEQGDNASITAAIQFLRLAGVSKAWQRDDGAVARVQIGAASMTLDLPQALKYEAELKGLKDQKQRQNARRLVQPDAQIPANRPPTSSDGKIITTLPYIQFAHIPNDQGTMEPPRGNAAAITDGAKVRRPGPIAMFVPLITLISMGGIAVFIVKVAIGLKGRSRHSVVPTPAAPRLAQSTPPPLPTSALKARSVSDLTWDEFELLVGEIYRRQGFLVELPAGTGADGGIDLTLHRGTERVLVQCKCWKAFKVSAPAIREFFGVIVSEKVDRGFFVTTGRFTRDAMEFAEGKPIEMIDGAEFARLLSAAAAGPDDELLNVRLWAGTFLAASRVKRPDCPFCKTSMVKRESRTGVFWGCSAFPRCRGKREMRKHAENCFV